MTQRSVFFLSDRTGITAETLGHSLLTQFDGITFEKHRCSFVNSEEKARQIILQIHQAADRDGVPPLVFSTLLDRSLVAQFHQTRAVFIDFFETFNPRLEQELGMPAAYIAGRSHGVGNYTQYTARIAALNFSLGNDDGLPGSDYATADIILLGVSRTGKTPASLYLSLQYGILAANYPLTEDDFERPGLPEKLKPHRHKLFGLTITPERLHQIRGERYPNSRYAELPQCRAEIRQAEALFHQSRLQCLDTTSMSVEEIAATVLQEAGLEQRVW